MIAASWVTKQSQDKKALYVKAKQTTEGFFFSLVIGWLDSDDEYVLVAALKSINHDDASMWDARTSLGREEDDISGQLPEQWKPYGS